MGRSAVRRAAFFWISSILPCPSRARTPKAVGVRHGVKYFQVIWHLLNFLIDHMSINQLPVVAALASLMFAGCNVDSSTSAPEHTLIPNPSSIEFSTGDSFNITSDTKIAYDVGDSEAARIGSYLADLVGNTVDTTPTVEVLSGSGPTIHLTRQNASSDLGPEGYRLAISGENVTVTAAEGAGLFYGVQTIRQLLPALVEYTAAYENPLPLPPVLIRDAPRFEWRGVMLDVARHFLPATDVKRFIDLMALYKMNRLHLHLSDDQGWRIEIPSRPRLTEIGSQLQVGGKGGGYYTVDEYEDIVAYADSRFITVVPEIDLPGHTNSALASYAELNCDGVARELYTGTEVGFSSVCPDSEETFRFIDDVVRDISAMTTGQYFHMGGDEVETLTEEEYIAFVERVQQIVKSHGKTMAGWDEIAAADLQSGSRVQLWRPLWPEGGAAEAEDDDPESDANVLKRRVERAVSNGVQFIASPADKIYLDMKYDDSTVLGLKWAGLSDTKNAYDWNIADVFSQIPESSIAGVEATLWSETFSTVHDFEYMAFPRLPGVAELGWSQADRRDWNDYRHRVAWHAERWQILGVTYRHSSLIPWPAD